MSGLGVERESRVAIGDERDEPLVPHAAKASPSAPPARPSHTASVSSWRMSRPRLAPIASRSAISRRRAIARASRRLTDVRRGDEQHRTDRAHEQQDGRPNWRRRPERPAMGQPSVRRWLRRRGRWLSGSLTVAAEGVHRARARGDRAEIGLCRVDRGTSRLCLPTIDSQLGSRCCEASSGPAAVARCRSGSGNPPAVRLETLEAARRDTDDHERDAIDRDRGADSIRTRPESPLPPGIAA